MEPSDEPVLKVNRTKTALVLGGSVPSAIPPDLLISKPNGFNPLQGDTVKILASILAPPLCPSALSSKFRVAVLLNGLPGKRCPYRLLLRLSCIIGYNGKQGDNKVHLISQRFPNNIYSLRVNC